jgi:hypothetical protein
MNKEKQEILYQKYPSLFIEKDLPKNQSCLYWGLECEVGWFDLIDRTCAKIMEIDKDKLVRFTQVKEKFGQLRIYYVIGNEPKNITIDNVVTTESITIKSNINNLDDKVFDILIEAERESSTICEVCGEPGKIKNTGWIKTLCNKCLEETGI